MRIIVWRIWLMIARGGRTGSFGGSERGIASTWKIGKSVIRIVLDLSRHHKRDMPTLAGSEEEWSDLEDEGDVFGVDNEEVLCHL
jgi:hypothetical protein